MQAERDHVWESLLLSLGLHVWVLHAGHWASRRSPAPPVEIDITSIGTEAAGLSATPVHPLAARQTPSPIPAPAPIVSAGPALAPSPSASAPSPPPMTHSAGADSIPSASPLRPPRLLNAQDLAALLRRLYPEAARAELRQTTVILDLHIDVDGSVRWADVVRSGGADFDAAALKAARLLRFAPAFDGAHAVAVNMRQAIQFKLED